VRENILVVDDDEGVRRALCQSLEQNGYAVTGVDSGEQALARLRETPLDLVILDLVLPRVDGLEVLKEITALRPEVAVVMITGYASVETAIKAMKMGAIDYVVKPFRMEEVDLVVTRSLERSHLRRENATLRRQLQGTFGVHNLVGQSAEMRRIRSLVEQVASSRSTVLISGASGTGKELVGKALHFNSDRRNQAFVALSCSGIPDALLEDELFGHVKGVTPDAVSDRPGRLASADGGTLFLDEIGSLGQKLQMKLLQVLQERGFTSLGSSETTPVDVRIVASTSCDLKKAVADGKFREDLYYRLNVIHIQMPPLRGRREDIPALVQHYLARYCTEMNLPAKNFDATAMKTLCDYSWPGNIRQLENVVERAVALSFGKQELHREDIPHEILEEGAVEMPPVHVGGDGFSLDEVLASYEQRMLYQALEHSGWVKTRAAELLKIKRTTLIEKMKRLGIPLKGNTAAGLSRNDSTVASGAVIESGYGRH